MYSGVDWVGGKRDIRDMGRFRRARGERGEDEDGVEKTPERQLIDKGLRLVFILYINVGERRAVNSASD